MPARISKFSNFNDQRHHDKIDLRYYTLIEFARIIAEKSAIITCRIALQLASQTHPQKSA